MKKIGKIGKLNNAVVKKLRKLYGLDEIDSPNKQCELLGIFPGCINKFKGFAHRHSRHWYRGKPEVLITKNQTMLLCESCHRKIDDNLDLKEQVFLRFRGKEIV